MSKEILKCVKCNEYTYKTICPKCGGECISPKPSKWSPEDKYSKYRLAYKKNEKH